MGLIVLSNRAPYSPVEREAEQVQWQAAVGGLTTAVEPILAARGGTWIAWGEAMPHLTSVELPRDNPRYKLERVALTTGEVERYYYGMSNRSLWPISHYFPGRASFSHDDWHAYVQVNRRFADAAVRSHHDGDVIWVHDYQLALAPGMIREALPDATIGFFWHIPWPAPEVFDVIPWAPEILQGILGSDLIGVHTPEYALNFARSCEMLLGARRDGTTLNHEGREVRVESHPIGVDMQELTPLARSTSVREAAEELRAEMGTSVLLGIDRLDYTKGIPERLEAYELLLRDNPDLHGKVTLVQLAVLSRESVEEYRETRAAAEQLVGRINGMYGRRDWVPVRYLTQRVSRERLAAYYRSADVMLVTPLRDGLNLVAKEFSALNDHGVLLLSRFAGAASEMTDAYLVNPFDREGLAQAMVEALNMPAPERTRRSRALREQLQAHDVHDWAERFLASLEGPNKTTPLTGAGA